MVRLKVPIKAPLTDLVAVRLVDLIETGRRKAKTIMDIFSVNKFLGLRITIVVSIRDNALLFHFHLDIFEVHFRRLTPFYNFIRS